MRSLNMEQSYYILVNFVKRVIFIASDLDKIRSQC